MTKKVQIFLASSAELEEDKEQVELFISRKNKDWYVKRIFLSLTTWRDFISSMVSGRTQDQYNKFIRKSDICIFLFHTKIGRYTREEFDNAHDAFLKHPGTIKKPRIYTYFKTDQSETSDIKEFRDYIDSLDHFYDTYTSMDDLFVKINKQLDKLENEGAIVKPLPIDFPKVIKYGLYFFVIPLLVLFGATGTIYYYQPGMLTVNLQEVEGIPNLPYTKGLLSLHYEGNVDSISVTNLGIFQGIPSSFKHKQARLHFSANGYKSIDTMVNASGSVELFIQRDSSLSSVAGIVKDESSLVPIANAIVRLGGYSVETDSTGYFHIQIPTKSQALEQRLAITKEGFIPFDEIVTVTQDLQGILLVRERR